MHFRQLLRTRFVGTGAAHLTRLHLVRRAEVSAPKTHFSCSLVLMHVLFSLSAAERIDNNCPAGPGGGCGEPAVPHRREVWFTVPLH